MILYRNLDLFSCLPCQLLGALGAAVDGPAHQIEGLEERQIGNFCPKRGTLGEGPAVAIEKRGLVLGGDVE